MFCSKCGQEMSDEAVFCSKCGTARSEEVRASCVPSPVNQPSADTYALAKSALTFAILSLVFSSIPVLSIAGIVMGAIGKKKANQARIENGGYFAKCRVAYILSSVGLGVSIAMTIFWPLYIALIAGVIVNGGSLGYYYSYR